MTPINAQSGALAFLIVLLAAAPLRAQTARLSGTVYEHTGAVVPGATVVVHGMNIRQERKTDLFGRYDIAVPAGAYDVRISLVGFCGITRPDVRIADGAHTVFNVWLTVCGTHSFYNSESKNVSTDWGVRKVHFEYGARTREGDAIEYRRLDSHGPPAAVLFDRLAIYADSILFEERSGSVTSTNAIIEDGVTRRYARTVRLDLKTRLIAASTVLAP